MPIQCIDPCFIISGQHQRIDKPFHFYYADAVVRASTNECRGFVSPQTIVQIQFRFVGTSTDSVANDI